MIVRKKRLYSKILRVALISTVLLMMGISGAYAVTAVPSGLGVTSGNGQAYVYWSSVSGAEGYNVYTSEDDTTYTKVNVSLITSTNYTITGLTNSEEIYVKVTSYDNGDTSESAKTTAITVTPLATSPMFSNMTSGSIFNQVVDWVTNFDGVTLVIVGIGLGFACVRFVKSLFF